MANKTNAFTTRHNNRVAIKELMDKLVPLWEANYNSYYTYITELRQLLVDNCDNPLTADQIACALGETDEERKSIIKSLDKLVLSARQARYMKNHYPDEKRHNPAIPELNREYVTKTRHFAEFDDNGNLISKFNRDETAAGYFLEK